MSIKAGQLLFGNSRGLTEEIKDKINKIVPTESTLNSEDVSIYELNENDGIITRLELYEDLPSDENFLNQHLEQTNELFAQLLEIEVKI